MSSANALHGFDRGRASRHGGFTLVELLVVIFIILAVSAVALPTVLPAITHRQVTEAARLLQGALAGARDAAIHSNAPRGIRLVPDPNFNGINPSTGLPDPARILAANRIVPIQPAPDYSEGLVSIIKDLPVNPSPFAATPPYPAPIQLPTGTYPYPSQVLMVEQCPLDAHLNPTSATSWYWNVRVGDKIQIGKEGPFYTVIGPMTLGPLQGNGELFVNDGLPGAQLHPLTRTYPNNVAFTVEYLFLVNGNDDDADGFVDNGWDGVNNNNNFDANGNPIVDELLEWTETEKWLASQANLPLLAPSFQAGLTFPITGILSQTYRIVRRPITSPNQKETILPSNVVIDLTTWGNSSPERSRLPVNAFTGYVDILVSPQGDVVPSTPYATPSSFGMASSFYHFWLAERGDLFDPDTSRTHPAYLPLPQGLVPRTDGRELKGESRLVTLFTRSGLVTINEIVNFDAANALNTTAPFYNPSLPFLEAQQGTRGGQ